MSDPPTVTLMAVFFYCKACCSRMEIFLYLNFLSRRARYETMTLDFETVGNSSGSQPSGECP
jgi:hypothetical protein